MQRYFEAHRAMLEEALTATARRTYWSAAHETPSGKLYGESAKGDAEAAFKAQLGKPFDLDQPGGGRRLGSEESYKGLDEVARGIVGTAEKLIDNPERTAALLGTIPSVATVARVRSVSEKGKPLLASRSFETAGSPGARTATPAILVADAGDNLSCNLTGLTFVNQSAAFSDYHGRQSVRQRLLDGHGLCCQPFPGGGRPQAGCCLRMVWDA